MFVKSGVNLNGIHPKITRALAFADEIWENAGVRGGVTVTSGLDGKHCNAVEGRPCPDGKPRSLHYEGRAVDLRARDLPAADRPYIKDRLLTAIGDANYDVVDEGDHIHLEHDPH